MYSHTLSPRNGACTKWVFTTVKNFDTNIDNIANFVLIMKNSIHSLWETEIDMESSVDKKTLL